MDEAVVLLSGGLDSATTLALAVSAARRTHALTVAYGQRHAVEVERARQIIAFPTESGGEIIRKLRQCLHWRVGRRFAQTATAAGAHQFAPVSDIVQIGGLRQSAI